MNVPSKDDLTQVEISIGERISANSRRLTRLEAQCQRDITEVKRHVEHLVTSRISEIRSGGIHTPSAFEEKRNAAYMLARRSMRICPVKEDLALEESCRVFFKECLMVRSQPMPILASNWPSDWSKDAAQRLRRKLE